MPKTEIPARLTLRARLLIYLGAAAVLALVGQVAVHLTFGQALLDGQARAAIRLGQQQLHDARAYVLKSNAGMFDSLGAVLPRKAGESVERAVREAWRARGEPGADVREPPQKLLEAARADSSRVLLVELEKHRQETHDAAKNVLALGPTDLLVAARDVFEPYQETWEALLAAVAAVSFLLLGTGIWLGLTRLVAAPLHDLEGAARQVQAGNLAARARADAPGELQAVARAFNDMASELERHRAKALEREAALETQGRELASLNQLLEDRVIKKSRELVHAERMAGIGTLAGGVAHELGNLLGGISGCAQDALESNDLEDVRENVAMIRKSTRRAREGIEALLNFSRRRKLSMDDVDLAIIVGEALRLLDKELQRAGVRVENALPASVPVRGDMGGLQQVFLNLITNAAHAMPGGGQLTISVRRSAKGTTVMVADTGTGIPAHVRDRVFDPFFTTKDGSTGVMGTGLGLPVSLGIIEQHGGAIEFTCPPGGGTTFSVFLGEKRKE